MTDAQELKSQYDAARLRALALTEGLKAAGNRIQCPACRHEDARSATVGTVDGVGVWHCQRCQEGGSAIDLIKHVRNCSDGEAMRILSDKGAPPPPPVKVERPPPDGARLWQLLAATDPPAVAYLEGRALGEVVERELVRFSVGATGDRWVDAKAAAGYRLAVPMRIATGEVIGFQLRGVTKEIEPGKAKLHLPKARPREAAFGMPLEARTADVVYLAEGMGDTLAVALGNVVVVGAPGEGMVKYLRPFLGEPKGRLFIACPQNDAHRKSQIAFNDLLARLQDEGGEVRVFATPAPHKDPAEWRAAVGPEVFDTALANARFGAPPVLNLVSLQGGGEERAVKWFPQTDLGNAERLVYRHGDDLRYCHTTDQWSIWSGKLWQRDTSAEVMRRAKETVRAIATEDEGNKSLLVFARKSEAAKNLNAMISLAKSEVGIPVEEAAFDANPWLFNCDNGTLDLQTGTMRSHRRGDLLSKISPVVFDETAKCPQWLTFLSRIFGDDQELIAYLQRFCGYCLTGLTREHVMHVFYGRGRNGKGTFRNTIAAMVGDYAHEAAFETFLESNHSNPGGPREDLMAIKGARLVTASERKDDQRLEESLIKRLTGEDPITTRRLHEGSVTFRPVAKYVLICDSKPIVKHLSEGFRARIRLVPFKERIPDHEQDQGLIDKLKGELPGILTWSVIGCLSYKRMGLAPPNTVKEATEEYLNEMDVVGLFLADPSCIVTGPKMYAPATDLYLRFKKWCDDMSRRWVSQTAFGTYLTDHGFTGGNHGDRRVRFGLGLVGQDKFDWGPPSA